MLLLPNLIFVYIENHVYIWRMENFIYSHKKINGIKQSQFTPKGLIGYSNVVHHWNPVDL